MSILVNRCLRRTNLVGEIVEQWQLDHKTAMLALDTEELISEYLDLCQLLSESWKKLQDSLFGDAVFDFDKSGRILRSCVEKTMAIGATVHGIVAFATERGHVVERALEFEQSRLALAGLHNGMSMSFPVFDTKLSDTALADYQRGSFLYSEDLLNALQGCGAGGN
jgi:hypothetical protein